MTQSAISTPVPVAIIGMGCLFPRSEDADAYWNTIVYGVDAISEVPSSHWQLSDYFDADPKKPDHTYAQRGGFLSTVDFPPLEFGVTPKALEATDTTQLLGLMAARAALEDGGYGAQRDYDRNKVSVILGITGTLPLVIPLGARLGHPIWKKALKDAGVPDDIAQDVMERIADGYVPWQEDSFPGLLGNVVAGRIANRLDLGGTNCVVDAACASSLSAIHLAMLELSANRCDMVLSGGMDTFNDIFMYMCFSKTPALSPTGNARPFAANGDGTILGEGLGCVLLKRLSDAERDGDKIYAVIRSIGTSSDGKGQAIYAPSPAGQAKALRSAYAMAGVTPNTIELVEAHGTGTKAGDAAEVKALTEVYRQGNETGSWCALGSVKSQIGHTKAAAGAAGLAKAALALHHKVLPPTIKVDQPQEILAPEQSPFYVNTVRRPWLSSSDHPRRAAVSSFGFGGSNFHCVLEEYQSNKPDAYWNRDVQLLTFSADDKMTLLKGVDDCLSLPWPEFLDRAKESRSQFNAKQSVRLTAVVQREQDREKLRQQIQAMASKPGLSQWALPDGVWYAEGPISGSLAALFPGQGSQSVGMLRDLACQFPEMQQALMRANDAYAPGQRSLSDAIYPHPAFSEATKQQQEEFLRGTNRAQPALGAVCSGAWEVLKSFGVQADAFAGHSFGELTALWAANTLSSEDFYRLAMLRGQLMANASGSDGGMLAVAANAETVERILKEHGSRLVIANVNSPTQTVISGLNTDIDQSMHWFAEKKIAAKKLPVSAAFHSPLVGDVPEQFLQGMEKTSFGKPAATVYRNTTGTPYSNDNDEIRAALAQQIASPVAFVEMIRNMYAAGISTFVEVGPGNVLSNLVQAILAEKPHRVMALDQSRGKQIGQFDLGCVLAQLSVLGYTLDLQKWAPNTPSLPAQKKPTMTVPLNGANYVSPKTVRPPVPQSSNKNVTPAMTAPTAKPKPVTKPTVVRPVQTKTTSQNAIESSEPISTPNKATVNRSMTMKPIATTPTNGQPMSNNVMNNANNDVLNDSIRALQQLSEQTSQLHKQYLDGQQQALQIFQSLVQTGHTNVTYHGNGTSQTNGHVTSGSGMPMPQTNKVSPVPQSQPTEPKKALTQKATSPVQHTAHANGHDRPASQPIAKPVTPTPVPANAPSPKTTAGKSLKVLLDVIAEKTGYPAEMLQPEMELDADLGIDSIKRVEIFSALQEKLPDAPAIQAEHVGSLRTLADVSAFLEANSATTENSSTNGIKVDGHSSHANTSSPSATVSTEHRDILLTVIAEKTGYPSEMLEVTMELDADLGIDSIKRVEIFSALQERLPNAPAIGAEHVGSLSTLTDVLEFLGGMANDSMPAFSKEAAPETTVASPVAEILLAVVADKTGYPAEMLQPEMELDADLGIDSIKRVEIFSALQEALPTAPAVLAEHMGSLRTLKDVIDFLQGDNAVSAEMPQHGSAMTTPVVETKTEPIVPLHRLVAMPTVIANADQREKVRLNEDGAFWLVGDPSDLMERVRARLIMLGYSAEIFAPGKIPDSLEAEKLNGILLFANDETGDEELYHLFESMKVLGSKLRAQETGKHRLLVAVTNLDGMFGFSADSTIGNPTQAGLVGMLKTARWEWSELTCKAMDVAPGLDLDEAALNVVAELAFSGPIEVGIRPDGLYYLPLQEIDQQTLSGTVLDASDVVVISGGARGVTAEIAIALAEKTPATLVLMGRSALPEAEPNWLQSLSDEPSIKRGLLEHTDKALTPKEVSAQYQQIMAAREIRQTLAQINACGNRVAYVQADVCDDARVHQVLSEIEQHYGKITGLIHGAGVLADRKIEDKTREQFERVYQTKINGLRTLLNAIDNDTLKLLVVFSSSTARFGRTGQVDYATANEVLNKMAQQFRQSHAACRTIACNWGPWAGGMVNPGLEQLFRQEGVELIPLKSGAQFLMNELHQPQPSPVEMVILGPGSQWPHEEMSKKDSLHLAYTREISVATVPVLTSHVINGKAVVPAALAAEWMAQAAMHSHPGYQFVGLQDLRILKGLTLTADQTVTIAFHTGNVVKHQDVWQIPVEIRQQTEQGKERISSRVTVLLAMQSPVAPEASPAPLLQDSLCSAEEAYEYHLFHGKDLQGITNFDGMSENGIVATVDTAPPPTQWLNKPLRQSWLTDPLALDSGFQLMVLWCALFQEKPSLPSFFKEYRQFTKRWKGPLRVSANIRDIRGQIVKADLEWLDSNGKVVATLIGYECVMEASLKDRFHRNRLASEPVTSR